MTATARPRAPSFLTHLLLLWSLRIRLGLNRGGGKHRLLSILSYAFSTLPALGLFLAMRNLMHWPPVAERPEWPPFILNLLCFVTTAVVCTWPVLSAGVDDHSELSRYAAFPLGPLRLLVASTVASLFEPRAIVFAASLAGAAVGYLEVHPPASLLVALLLALQYFLLNAAMSRVGVNLMLQVLKSPRSAELLGGGFVLFLVGCSFLPPVDTSWLTQTGGGVSSLKPDVLLNAALALGTVPPGFFGAGLEMLAGKNVTAALLFSLGQTFFIVVSLGIAYWLLLRFHRGEARTVGSARAGPRKPFAGSRSTFGTLVAREAFDLWKNPRARLLAAVPFILAILLKLLSGRALVAWMVGSRADAWLAGSLALYGALVMASTFSQNAFAYDGHGMATFLSSPIELGQVLRAKNLVHATAAGGVTLALLIFYRVYFREGSPAELLLSFLAVLTLVPVVLATGNFLSVYLPVKFHADLKRRDRLPLLASSLGVAGAGLGGFPFIWALRHCTSTAQASSLLAFTAVLGVAAYAGSFPVAAKLLVQRRERVFAAVTRD